MKTINQVTLRARLSKDGELKTFSNNGSIAKLVVCTENNFKNKEGNWQKEAEFHTIVVRGNKASEASRFKKGQMVDISGRLKTRSYEVNSEKRYTTEVVTWEVKEAQEHGEPAPRQEGAEVNYNRVDAPNGSDDLPF